MARLSVALVYPPFGPSALPSLGLSLLCARVKEAGYPVRCFYWNMEFASQLDAPDLETRLRTYDDLTQRLWHPLNEWIFTPALYDGESPLDDDVKLGLLQMSVANPQSRVDAARVLDLRERCNDAVADFAERLAPFDVIGIGSTFYQNIPALALARYVKRRWPQKSVVIGGANADGPMGPSLLRCFEFLDFAFVGETDRGFVALLDGLDDPGTHRHIPGLVFRELDGTVAQGPPNSPESRMDDLPVPDFTDYIATWDQLGFSKHRELVLNMETSRGCWWGAKSHCTFCGLNANGMAYRRKSLDRVISEMEELKSRYEPHFLFMTDNILSMDYFDTVLDWLEKNDLGVDFFYEIKSNVTRRQVEKLARSRVTSVQPGIESFSSSVLKTMRKGVSAAQNVAFLKYAREYGVRTCYNIIVGFPGEDETAYDRFIQQIPRLVHLQPPTSIPFVEFHRFSPYHDHPERFGIDLVPSASYKVLYPYSGAELANIVYYFVRAELGGTPPSLPYFDTLVDTVFRWMEVFDEQKPLLRSQPFPSGLEIVDERAPRRVSYRLRGTAAEVYSLLDRPQSIASLKRVLESRGSHDGENEVANYQDLLGEWTAGGSIPIVFDKSTFLADPEECLSLFDEAGLIFVDNDPGAEPLFVALSLPSNAVSLSKEWLDAHV